MIESARHRWPGSSTGSGSRRLDQGTTTSRGSTRVSVNWPEALFAAVSVPNSPGSIATRARLGSPLGAGAPCGSGDDDCLEHGVQLVVVRRVPDHLVACRADSDRIRRD